MPLNFIRSSCLCKRQKKESEQWKYDIECAGIGSEGTFLIKVWSYEKMDRFPLSKLKRMPYTEFYSKVLQELKDALHKNPS